MTKPAYFLDLLVVLLFAAAGRASHDLDGDVLGVLATAWPFLLGLAAGWVAVLRQPGAGPWWLEGLVVAVCTVVLGLLLRSVSGGGTATAFVLVATGTLLVGLVGWRGVAALVARRAPA